MNKQIPSSTFSIVKALGIILVVISHSAIHTHLSTFAYLINIAIFFFVAGYFFKDEYLYKPHLFFRKKIVRYYIPWVLYGLVFVFLHNAFLSLGLMTFDYKQNVAIEPYTFEDIVLKSIEVLSFFKWKEPLLAPLWFLFGMFSGFCVFYSISWFAKKVGKTKFELVRAVLVVAVMIVGFLGDEYNLRLGIIYRPMVISGLIYIGKLYSICAGKIKLSPIFALLCFVALLIATVYNYQINIGGMVFGNPILFLLISCVGNYMLLTLAYYIDAKTSTFSKVLNYIGAYSFSIMVLHYVSFKLVVFIQLWICNYPSNYLAYYPVIPYNTNYWWVAYTIVGVAVPLFLASSADFIKQKVTVIFKNRNLKL